MEEKLSVHKQTNKDPKPQFGSWGLPKAGNAPLARVWDGWDEETYGIHKRPLSLSVFKGKLPESLLSWVSLFCPGLVTA